MDRGARTSQGLIAAMFAAALLALAVPAAAAPARTAPSPSVAPIVKTIVVTGAGLTTPLTISSTTSPQQFSALVSEIDWLAYRPGVIKAPAADKLGVKFTVVLNVNGVAKQTYDVYPLASGGPRAFRPAVQPDKRKVSAAWFYGRLTMPAALTLSGVPLGATPAFAPGGAGGGTMESVQAGADLESLVGDWQRFVGLNGAVVVVLGVVIFAVAYMVRRRV